MEILDAPVNEVRNTSVKYGGFWIRFGALFIDGLILAPVTIGLMYFNMTSLKSVAVLVVITLVQVAYKPLMEIVYGATWGKMALKLKVVTTDMEKAEPAPILLRNIFGIGFGLISLFFMVDVYTHADFEFITGFMEYSTFMQQFIVLRIISGLSGLTTIVDAIVLLADQKKRSLHDQIGGTLVIEE